MADVGAIQRKFETLAGVLDERARRLVAAAEAMAVGFSGSNLGGPGQRAVAWHCDPRHRRTQDGTPAGQREANPAQRCGTQADGRPRSDTAARPGGLGGTRDAWGSGITVAL